MSPAPLAQGRRELAEESATELAGSCVAGNLRGGIIYLQGELGVGKTTFCRGLLRGAGHRGPVKSPTFTLVESYLLLALEVHHFDLYRLANAEELEFIGLRDYLGENTLCLIEWPERGAGVLPPADLTISLCVQDLGRVLNWQCHSQTGVHLATGLGPER